MIYQGANNAFFSTKDESIILRDVGFCVSLQVHFVTLNVCNLLVVRRMGCILIL